MSNDKDSRFNQGPPGMLPDGEINTLGPDGKPTHPVKVYTADGRVLTFDEFGNQAEVAVSDLDDDDADYDDLLKAPPV